MIVGGPAGRLTLPFDPAGIHARTLDAETVSK
jgi:hypothetical protein